MYGYTEQNRNEGRLANASELMFFHWCYSSYKKHITGANDEPLGSDGLFEAGVEAKSASRLYCVAH